MDQALKSNTQKHLKGWEFTKNFTLVIWQKNRNHNDHAP